MSAPRFRCTADEPPETKGGMFGPEHQFDDRCGPEGLVLDEFVLDGAVHLERLNDRPYIYSLHVGMHHFVITRRRGKWEVSG